MLIWIGGLGASFYLLLQLIDPRTICAKFERINGRHLRKSEHMLIRSMRPPVSRERSEAL